jgi:mono/diheme cytochrome c family protein
VRLMSIALAAVGAAIGSAVVGAPAAFVVVAEGQPPGTDAPFDDPGLPALLREASPARVVFERHCLTCHGLPIVAGQRLTSAQWQGVVAKMRDKFKAPLVAGGDEEAQIVALLTAALPPELAPAEYVHIVAPTGPLAEPGYAAVTAAVPGGDAERGAVSYAFACSSCHGKDGLGGALGPRLRLRPALADEAAFRRLIAEGLRAMPALPGVSEDDTRDILAYLRAPG